MEKHFPSAIYGSLYVALRNAILMVCAQGTVVNVLI
jgi:hypothetical protein